MGAMMLHPESREEVRQLLTQPPEIQSILDGMDDVAKRLSLRDAALLASVDGDYDKGEIKALQEIAKSCGFNKKDLSKILDWVNDCWKLSATGRSLVSAQMLGDDKIIKG